MLCEVINYGLTFHHYYDKARELGADLNIHNSKDSRLTTKYKWQYGRTIGKNGGIYKILNEIGDSDTYRIICLIERLSDGHQFVIAKDGLKIKEYLLEDKLFEL
jgi:hypothetical protein